MIKHSLYGVVHSATRTSFSALPLIPTSKPHPPSRGLGIVWSLPIWQVPVAVAIEEILELTRAQCRRHRDGQIASSA